MTKTLTRYFAGHFLRATLSVFIGVFVLFVLVDYVETTRRTADLTVSAWTVAKMSLNRVPQAAERFFPFAVLVGTMLCYLNLSRRLELVVARAAGLSAWQFIAPSMAVALLLGILATTAYNPISSAMRETAKRIEAELMSERRSRVTTPAGTGFWIGQRNADGQSIINASASREQGVLLDGVTAFNFDSAGKFVERVEATSAKLEPGHWRFDGVRVYAVGQPVQEHESVLLRTSMTPEQVRENLATPETVSFWELPSYIHIAERNGLSAAGYKLQYQLLIARPFLLVGMVLLSASVSLHLFRAGGASRMVLSGIVAGFLLYVLSKVTEDLSKAELMHPVAAAWIPVLVGGLTGFVTLLYQEDG